MTELIQYAPGKVQPEARGALVLSAVEARVAVVKHARQVLRRDADARVLHDHGMGSFIGTKGHTAPAGVLDRVAEHLLEHKGQPLFIREGAQGRFLIVQAQLFSINRGAKRRAVARITAFTSHWRRVKSVEGPVRRW